MKTLLAKALVLCTGIVCAQNNFNGSNQNFGTTQNIAYETFNTSGGPTVLLPRTSLLPEQLAVIVNSDDPISDSIANYYLGTRGIPSQNKIVVSLNTSTDVSLNQNVFVQVMHEIDSTITARQLDIQAMVLVWRAPNFFDGPAHMGGAAKSSVCAAFANGALLQNPGSHPHTHTLDNGFFNSNSSQPYTDFGIRPVMHLMTDENTYSSVKDLIDRGVSADATFPAGDGYLIRTEDRWRNTRWGQMISATNEYTGLNVDTFDLSDAAQSYLSNTPNILYYFTGNEVIKDIETNTYVPGAICDHLTSGGGRIGGGQMFAGEWIDAGATATYGTVSEPTNSTTRFPNVKHLIREYFQGGTVMDAYWKSVYNPSLGNFMGEPLARPYKPVVNYAFNTLSIKTSLFDVDQYYLIEKANSTAGPWSAVQAPLILPKHEVKNINIPAAQASQYYRITPDYIDPSQPYSLTHRFVPDSVIAPCNYPVPHCEIKFKGGIDNTGEIKSYKIYIDGNVFQTITDVSQPLVRIGYNPWVDVVQLVDVQISAVDKNGNESLLSQTLTLDLPYYHFFGSRWGSEGEKGEDDPCDNVADSDKAKNGTEQTAYNFELLQNYPNPFQQTTNIAFSIPDKGDVELSIYSLSGQLVWSFEKQLQPGPYVLEWNGQDHKGRVINPGVYLCELKYKDHSKHIKLIAK